MRISVIGNGGWGTALARLLDSYGHAVTVWGPFPADLDEIRNVCRCGTYFRIREAIKTGAKLM